MQAINDCEGALHSRTDWGVLLVAAAVVVTAVRHLVKKSEKVECVGSV